MEREATRGVLTLRPSPREVDVLAAAANGWTRKRAAFLLGISVNTLDNCHDHAHVKLGAASAPQAVATAIRLGLLTWSGTRWMRAPSPPPPP